jgi:hypothetical protein
MYRLLRDTHLVLGLFCCLFLLMYGVSSVQMAHNRWFTTRPAVKDTAVILPAQIADARVIGRQLMDQFHLRGEVGQARVSPAQINFVMVRPGTVYQVEYNTGTGITRIRDNHADFIGMLNRIHHAAGLWHDYWLLNAWGSLVGIVSAALILIGMTGIYLWFKLHQERLLGLILLTLSLGYSLTLMVLARIAW